MPVDRYYTSGELQEGKSVFLAGKEHHHLIHVTRHRKGDKIEVVNGRGSLAEAEVLSCSKKEAELLIEKVVHEKKPEFDAVIAQAIPRTNRLDFILEKGTELGMSQLWLFPSALSERKEIGENQLERMTHVMVAAMKQCGRLYLPRLVVKRHFHEWDHLRYPLFYGDPEPNAPHFSEETDKLKKGVIFFIGPESGFTGEEEKQLEKMGAKGVRLHPNVLRTDTAPLVALSLIYSRH